jgi:hypothetical protein
MAVEQLQGTVSLQGLKLPLDKVEPPNEIQGLDLAVAVQVWGASCGLFWASSCFLFK